MTDKVKAILERPFYRYVVVGGTVYIFEILAIVVAQKLGASTLLAVGLSFWLGFLLSFLLQKFIAFGDKRTHHKIVIPQFIATAALVLFNFGFTLLVTKLLEHVVPTIVTRTLALGITTFWNFYFYKTRIFNEQPRAAGNEELID
jgi:putative flippase GtrA